MLGYGVNAYFDMLSSLSYMFIMITIFCLPIFYLYGEHHAFADYKSFQIARFTMGNMGGSSIFCQQFHMSRGSFTANCPLESYMDTDKVMFGMMSADTKDKSACTQKRVDEVAKRDDLKDCSSTLNMKATRDRIVKEC